MFISCVYVTADDEIRPQAVYNLGVRFAYMTVALCRKWEGFYGITCMQSLREDVQLHYGSSFMREL